MSRPAFYIIDGHAVAYRQFFGLPVESFRTRAGEPTNAVYGFTRTLLDILEAADRPDYLAVSFDMGLSGRDTVFADYKGTRAKMEDDMIVQMPRIKQVVQAFNIPILELEGYEADDVIGTVVPQAIAEGVDVRIITGDRDLLQLLHDHVTVQLPSRQGPDEVFDIPAFIRKYTIHPDQLVDQKALMGDSSDNIPGIRGIGEKTAVKLLKEYQTLDGIYENIDAIKGSLNKKLVEGQEMAYISRQLARIRDDVPVMLHLPDCVSHDYDKDTVVDLFKELEFRGFTDRVLNMGKAEQMDMFADEDFAPPALVDELVETIVVQDEAALQDLVDKLNHAKAITWDVETTSVDQMAAELVGIALAVNDQTGYYIPVGHQKGRQLPLQDVIAALREPLTNPNIPKYAHNAAYDLVVTGRYGIDVTPVTFDTMIAEWLHDPESKYLGLKNFAIHVLGVEMMPITNLLGTGKKQKTMDEIAIEQAAPYAAADAAITYRAADHLRPILEEQALMELYETLELPLIPVIASMERHGIVLDVPYLREMSESLGEKLNAIEQEIHSLSGGYGEFNINSPKQLNDVLFGKLGLPVEGLKKTAHGYSTDAATLERLRIDTGHPIIERILEHRELTKLKGTYVDALPELVNPHTGRLHTSYNQTGTSTGRLSSSNPNLQNIPIRTEIGREVRRAFVAPEGCLLLAVDYSQIELRVLAHISQDETLLEAFAQDQDIHAATAAAVYGIPVQDVDYEQRSFAKRVNFGLIYGMGAFRLARDSGLPLSEARAFIDRYFERLPKVQEYIETTKQKARNPEGLATLFGRKRHFPILEKSSRQNFNRNVLQAEERAAINMPIQGTAADIMKRAMIDVYHALQESNLHARMNLQVHDELMFEVPEAEIDTTVSLIVEIMENAYPLDAPLKANAQIGPNWRDMS